jgi:gas vesicle protein
MNSGKILLGVLAGVAAGALIGVLLAPDKGSETRKKIAQKSDDLTEGLKEKFNEFISTMSDKYDLIKEDASDFAAQTKSTLKDAEHEMRTAKS